MNGFDSTRKKDASATKTRLLQELEKLTARKKAIEKQLQLLRSKKLAAPPPPAPVQEPVPVEPSFGLKRPATSTVTADAKRPRVNQTKDKKHPDVWKSCLQIVRKLKSHRIAAWFQTPVDGKIVTDYYDIIKTPMDLSTVMKRLEQGLYKTPLEFRDDMRLIWTNCRLYNKPQTQPARDGEQLSSEFEQKWLQSRIQELWEGDMGAQDAAVPQPPGFHSSKPPNEAMRVLDAEMRHRLQSTRVRADGDGGQDLSFEEKRKLSVKLGELAAERMGRVLEIVEEDVKAGVDADAEVELDIDQLSASTLRKLWEFVNSKEKPSKPSRLGQQSHSGAEHMTERQENHQSSPQAREIKPEAVRSAGDHGSPSSSSAGSGGSASSDSPSRGLSQEKVASAWGDAQDFARQPSMAGGDPNGAATVDVSTTEKFKTSIIKQQSHKKDLALKNASQWAHAVATTKVQANGKSSDKRDELWDQFVSLDEKQLAKKREEEEHQERERHEKEQREEKERQARVEQQAAEEAKKRDLAAQKEKELERLQGMAGTAKLTNQTDYELADMPKSDIDMNKVLGLKPIEADDDEY